MIVNNSRPKKPSSNWKKKLGFLLLGVIIGALSSFYRFSSQVETLYWDKTELENKLSQTEERVSKLEEELRSIDEQWSDSVTNKVKNTEIIVDYESSSQVIINIEEYCQEIAQEVIGHKTNHIEPKLIFQMFDKRSIKIDGKEYLIRVRSLIFSETLTLWVEPKEMGPS